VKWRIIGASLVIVVIAVLAIAFSRRNNPPGDRLIFAPTPESETVTASATPTPPPGMTPSDPARQVTETTSQRLAAEADPQFGTVREMLRDYRARLGENPVGTNEEITRALLGKNPGGANFESSEMKIENGKLVDRWHHPYLFHQLSRTEMEIRSAGPDGVMWTTDDEVLH
jgi:hypothetical protein